MEHLIAFNIVERPSHDVVALGSNPSCVMNVLLPLMQPYRLHSIKSNDNETEAESHWKYNGS